MLETLAYLAAAVAATSILAAIAPPDTSLTRLIAVVGFLTALLAAARHGPTQIVAVIDACSRLLGR